jgi:hypothetical protein
VEFDTYKYIKSGENINAKAEKTKVGKKTCRWVQLPNHQKSIMPSILEELLKARADTRKLSKASQDPFMKNILDKRQIGYKTTANSLYGQCGAKTSTFYDQDVAASTTATGRMMITYAQKIIEETYGNLKYETKEHGTVKCRAEYIYGDSVAGYTPVTIRYKDKYIELISIETVALKYGCNKWVICIEEGKQEKEYCELLDLESWTEKGWTKLHRVIRHHLSEDKKMIRIVTATAIVDVTDDHSLVTQEGLPISPNIVSLHTRLMHRKVHIGSNDSISDEIKKFKLYSNGLHKYSSHIDAANHFIYLTNKGYNTLMRIEGEFIIIDVQKTIDNSKDPYQIQNIQILPKYCGYVYDMTTDNHHFAAGIGNLIVHNTDSVFFTFNLKDPDNDQDIRGKKALEITIEIAQDVAKVCTQFLKPPMELTYEKTLMQFILLSKKRYTGILYEQDSNKGKLKYMGLSIKRRDSCDYLKDVYGNILNILMRNNTTTKDASNIKHALSYMDKSLLNLIDGKVPMEKLTITKALRGYYKNPSQIAHQVLAERIGDRDPGSKPKSGERIKFVHILSKNRSKNTLQGEKIETPEFITQKGLSIDYTFYITNQIMKPIQQLFGLALEQIWEIKGKIGTSTRFNSELNTLRKECSSLEEYNKKREKICSEKVKILLFNNYLDKIYNNENKIQQITSFFQHR